MNFKRYHVSKNLFDKDTATIYEATISSNGSWTSGSGATVRIPVVPSTTYTLHTNNIQSVFRITEIASDNLPPVSGNLIIRSSNINSYTFTTSENANYIVFQAGVDTTQQWISELMLNEGSTALPYEPYSSEVWHDTPHYIHNTSTDTITTPADIYANDTTATVELKGDMRQSSTPSPDSPIQPQECGERTGNLFSSTWEQGSINGTTGQNEGSSVRVRTAGYVEVIPSRIYSISRSVYSQFMNLRFYSADKSFIGAGSTSTIRLITGQNEGNPMSSGDSFCCFEIIDTNIKYMRIGDQSNDLSTRYMMVEGEYTRQTMPEYEPWGIKIPILSNSQITNVYLGEVQTTRRIKKLILTGEETWNYATSSQVHWIENVPNDYDNKLISKITTTCTHYRCIQNNTGFSGMVNGDLRLYAKESSPIAHELYIKDETYTSATDFKAYLQQQYAAGTPVCVWYVLATPETAVVNEPLRKIGNYADEVANISIPVTAGANTLSVDTTLQPSEVTVNYKGWHPVADVHEKSRNLFDELYPDVTTTIVYKAINVGNGSFTLSTNAPLVNNGALLFMLAGDVTTGASTSNNGVSESVSRTVTAVNGYITIAYIIRGGKSPADYEVMLNTGSTVLPYEPYWT